MYQKVVLIGNLGAKPELNETRSGVPVANLSLATNERWTKDGQRQERTEWHRVVLWQGLAEIASQYLKKGDRVLIEGRIQSREYEDRNGNPARSYEIVGNELRMLGNPNGNGGNRNTTASPNPTDPPASPPPSYNPEEDDIPF